MSVLGLVSESEESHGLQDGIQTTPEAQKRTARMLWPLQSRTNVGPLQQPMRTAHPEPGEDLRGNMREQHESRLTTHGASKSEPSEHARMIQNATAEQTERLDKSFDMSFKTLSGPTQPLDMLVQTLLQATNHSFETRLGPALQAALRPWHSSTKACSVRSQTKTSQSTRSSTETGYSDWQ